MRKKKENAAIVITKHAFERAKKRLSFTKAALLKMAWRAFHWGITRADTKGFLHKYVDRIWIAEQKANNVRIYGEVIYLFADKTLITVYQVPSELRKLVRVSKS
jgi:hypothetical protein